MARTRIKVCGVRDEGALFGAADAGVDAVGFVFHPASKRFIEPEEAFELIGLLPPFVSSVGVFTNAPLEKFSEMEEVCPTTFSQLSGTEKEDLVKQCGPGVIKVVRLESAAALAVFEKELARFDAIDEVDAIMAHLDAPSGAGFEVIAAVASALAKVRKPLMVGGGIVTAENVGEIVRVLRPHGVDVVEAVESAPGEISVDLVEEFCEAVRRADLDEEN